MERGWPASSGADEAGVVDRDPADELRRGYGAGGNGNGSHVLANWTFTAGSDAPGAARALVQDALDGTDAELDVILLMVSELVTNAVLHTRRNARLRVLDLGDKGYRIEVEDHDTHMPERTEETGATGGFGLRIIDNFARTWGTTLVGATADGPASGKVVWFEIDRHG